RAHDGGSRLAIRPEPPAPSLFRHLNLPLSLEKAAQPVLSQNPPVLHGGAGDNRRTKQSDHQIGLRRRPARIGRIGWLAVATQVIENPRNHCRFLDTGDHPQLPATAPTDLDGDREYAFEPLRPGETPLPIAGRCFATLTGPVGSGDPGL